MRNCNALPDYELVQRTRQGDSGAFGELWSRYEGQVLSLCRRYLAGPPRDPAVDEHDLATETFIRALHGLDRYEDRSAMGAGFEAWLLEVAKRICLKFLARQRRRRQWTTAPLMELEERPVESRRTEQLVQERETLRLAAEAINALPESYRVPFKLFLEEHPQTEIAATLGITVESAAKRIQRARARLRTRLAVVLPWAPTTTPRRRLRRENLRVVEQSLAEIVSDYRIVAMTLPSGGEMQLCLRVDRKLAGRAPEIEQRRALLEGHPRAWKRRLELAEICYHSGRWEEAREEYRAVLVIYPGCVPAALRLGSMLRHTQQATEEAHVYRDALRQHPPPALTARLEGHLRAAEGRDTEAVAAFRRAITLAPDEKAAHYGLFSALGRLSRYEEQLEVLAAVRALDPEDLPAHVGVYTPCARQRRFDRARPLLERAVAIDPNSPGAVLHLFQVRMNLGLIDDETLALAERLVRLAPEFVGSWSELAWIYAELGRDEESLAVLREYLREHPNNAEAHCALAWRHHYLRQPVEAAVHARQAYLLEPASWHVCWTLIATGSLHAPTVSDTEAFGIVEAIAARFPNDSAALRSVSGLYMDRGQLAHAITYARRSVELSPVCVESQAHLALLHVRRGHWPDAAKAYERLVELTHGRCCSFLSAWARALQAMADPRADALLAQAVSLAQSPGDYLQLGSHLEACGRRAEAVAAFNACLAQTPLATHCRREAESALRRLAQAPPP